MLERAKAIAFYCLFSLMAGAAFARGPRMTCPLLEVRSIASSEDSEDEALRAAGPDREAPPSQTYSAARSDSTSKEEVTILALGPLLDSLDSHKIKLDLTCTADGAILVATVTRYSGGVIKNVFWRPRIRIVMMLRQPEVLFQTTWTMRRTDGTELDHVGGRQKYPVTVTTTIRAE